MGREREGGRGHLARRRNRKEAGEEEKGAYSRRRRRRREERRANISGDKRGGTGRGWRGEREKRGRKSVLKLFRGSGGKGGIERGKREGRSLPREGGGGGEKS